MKKSYKSPIVWAAILVGILFIVMGKILTTVIHSDVRYLFYPLTEAGYMIIALFGSCAAMNFFGSQFTTSYEFTKTLPAKLVLTAALVAFTTLFAIIPLGIENRFSLPILYTGVGVMILSTWAAFFIRGMSMPDRSPVQIGVSRCCGNPSHCTCDVMCMCECCGCNLN